ncbi:MAG TPA: thioredoxin family protein [Polyangiaceae bacterium]
MKTTTIALAGILSILSFTTGCAKSSDGAHADSTQSPTTVTSANVGTTTPAATAATDTGKAAIGQPAPNFTLKDLDGKSVSLADFKGKVVVLEWFNPHCPFVRMSHTKASLKELPQKAIANGVVWLAINSSAAGKEGSGVAASKEGATTYKMTYPILLDESGSVGHMYGATNTPNMFVIDKTGTLVYSGAIDNSPDAEGESPTDGKLVNYVSDALDALAAGKPVAVAQTKAYGCSVKY